MDAIKYTELLDIEWTVKKSVLQAQSKYDEFYQKYGKKDTLTKIVYSDLKEARQSHKSIQRVIEVLRAN